MPNSPIAPVSRSATAQWTPIAGLTVERVLTISIGDAWEACGRDEAVFAELIQAIAIRVAQYHGGELGDVDIAAILFADDVETFLETDGTEKLSAVLGDAVAKAIAARVQHGPMPAEIVSAYNTVRECADKRALCHAPATSMYFGRNGYVTACCYSRANPLGRWPQETVSEIWSGSKIGNFREQLARNVLPMGCDTCADQLRAKNFKGLLAHGFDSSIPAPENALFARLGHIFRKPRPVYPVRLEFELSNKCNLECDMCSGVFSSSIRANRENKPPLAQVYDSRFVEQLRPFIPHLKDAKFLGGEPFLIDLYYEIWELFIELNPECQITITTNGTVFTPKVQRMLEKLNFQIVMSLDSVTKPTYEAIRRNATMERTLEHLEQYRAILQPRGKPVTMAVCPMRTNWREIPGLVAFANERDMGIFFNTVTHPPNVSLKFLPAGELAEVAEHLKQGILQAATKRQESNFRALRDLSRQMELWSAEAQVTELVVL